MILVGRAERVLCGLLLALLCASTAVLAHSTTTSRTAMTAAGCPTTDNCVDAGAFGAVPDDTGDDHASLTAAVAEAAPTRGTVFVPPGTYLLSRPLYLPTGVSLVGAGLARTTLLLSWPDLSNFSYNYLLAPTNGTATDVTVRDLTVDGGRRRDACSDGGHTGSCRPNAGGGVTTGSRWTVQRVRFTGMNYFKLWICGGTQVKVLDDRWDNLDAGVGSGDEDNIGGGCGAREVTIAGNRFAESIEGSVINLTRASFVHVSGNTSGKNSIIFEGVTDSSINDSTVLHGDINIISNSRYASSARYGNFNPARVTIAGNTIDGGIWGINISYANHPGAANHSGGANTIAQNRISRTSRLGIVVASCDRGAKTSPDTIDRNLITDTDTGGAASYNAGCAQFDPVAIGLGAGSRDRITANHIVDTRSTPLTAYAISVGDLVAAVPTSDTLVNANTATGVEVRDPGSPQ